MPSSRVTELERLIPGETKEARQLRAQISHAIDDAVRARLSGYGPDANGVAAGPDGDELRAIKNGLATDVDVTARLHRLNARLLASSELAPSLMEVLDATIAVQHADFGTLHLYRATPPGLQLICQRDVPEILLNHIQTIDESSDGLIARALTARSRVVVTDVSRDTNFEAIRPFAAAAGYRAVNATPILNRAGETLGVLTTFFRGPHVPGEHELRITDLYVSPAAEFISLKLAEQALRSSEARLASIFAQAPVGLCELSLEGRFERVNDQLCQLLGRTREDLLKLGVSDVTHPDHLDTSLAAVARLIVTGHPQTLDKRYVRPDRTWVWASSILTRLDDSQGRPQAILVVTIDLTARRQAERRVRESEERLRLAIEAANVFTWEFDVNTRTMKFSRNVAQVVGIPASSVTENDAILLIHPDDRERVLEEFGRAVQSDTVFDREFRVINPSSSQTLWVRTRGQLVWAGDGSPPRMAGVMHNVTDQKTKELNMALLAEVQADLIAASEPNIVLPTIADKIAGHFRVPQLFFTAIDSAAATATVLCEHAVNHADPRATSSIAETISAGILHELIASRTASPQPGDADPLELALDRHIPSGVASHAYAPHISGGRWRFVIVAASLAPREWRRDEIELLGELAARVWARLERARADAELRISEEKFRQVSDSGILSIAFFDRRGVLTDANDAFLRMVEYSREDLRSGRLQWADLTPSDWTPRMQQAMEDFEGMGRIAPYEQEYFKSDRSRFWALFGGARLDEHGHGVAFLLDVTDRRRAEEALRDSEARLRRAIEIPTVGIVFFNLAGFVTDANDAFLQMTGYTSDDVAERRVRWDLMTPPEWRPRSRRAEEEFKSLGQTTPYEKQYIRKNGTRWWALFAATRLSENEGVEYVIDITERKATEEQLRRYKEDLELRVQERTIELDSINGALREEITERQRAESARQEAFAPAGGRRRRGASADFPRAARRSRPASRRADARPEVTRPAGQCGHDLRHRESVAGHH